MNLIEIAEDLKNVPDQYLMQEVQQPTGNYPAYLVVSELSRRKRMREKVAKEMPTQTVAEELATPPEPPMIPQGMPQGLMAMPQAQTELAAQDAMGTTPTEMMMPQRMASGGMVSFRQGGDVDLDGMFSTTPYADGGMGLPQVMARDPSQFITGMLTPSTVYFAYMTPEEQAIYEQTGVVPETAKQKYIQAQVAQRQPTAAAPAAVRPTSTAPAPASAPAVAPGGATGGPRASVPQINIPEVAIPEIPTEYARQTARAQRMSDYEQAVPDRLTPFLQEAISKREGDIESRRASNINDALIQAGLGAMRAKPKFGGTAGLFEVIGAGGQEGFNVLREGRKDIRQSEESLLSARAKMMEAQALRDERKFKLSDDAEKQAMEDYKLGLDRANTQSAIALREAQAYAYRNRPTGLDKTIATPDQIAQARIRAMTDLAATVKKPTQAQIDAAMDAILAESGLRRATAGGIAQSPETGGAEFLRIRPE